MKHRIVQILDFFRFNKSNVIITIMLLASPFFIGTVYSTLNQTLARTCHRQFLRRIYIDSSWAVSKSFDVDIYLFDAQGISAWQVELNYDPYSLVVLNVKAGNFLSSDNWVVNSTHLFYSSDEEINYPSENALKGSAILVFADDIAPGVLLLGGCRFDLQSVNGSGKVATITFGVWRNGNNNFDVYVGKYLLLDTDLAETNRGSMAVILNNT